VVIGAIAVVVVLAVAVVALRDLRLPDVRATVEGAGVWAPVLFVLLQGAITITPIPRTVFTVAAGVLFGSFTGVLLAVVGTTLAASIAYWLVRLAGGRFVERHAHRRGVSWVRERLDHSGLLAMVSLRLIPAVPFSVMNYASTLSGARFVPYVLATVIGVLPDTVSIVVLGDAAVGGNPHPAMLVVSIVGGLLGLTGAAVVARRRPATS